MQFTSKWEQLPAVLVRFSLIFLFFGLIFFMARLTFLFVYAQRGWASFLHPDLPKALLTGFRFDGVVLAYALLPYLLGSLFYLFKEGFAPQRRWLAQFLTGIFFILYFLIITDFQFYKFFQSHFNLLVFGFFQDDTWAVLQSVWLEHPILRIILLLAATVYFVWKVVYFISQISFHFHWKSAWANTLLFLVFLGLYVLMMRGSVGTFPLEKDDAVVSSDPFMNSLTMNGVFALKDALEDRNKYAISTDTNRTFRQFGFADFQEAVQAYFQWKERPHFQKALNALLGETNFNPLADSLKPNVVFIQMESQSNWYLNLHRHDFNLLGELENQLPDCFLFRDFTSIRNGTIHTLEGLMVNTPLTPLSQSQFFKTRFSTSAARPYWENGYQTRFITGAKLGWRNLDKFVENQYFETAEGSASLLKNVPGAEACEWGVYDQYMFDRMLEYLSEAKKPQFIFGMSTTNHTPFELPKNYSPFPLKINDSLASQLRCSQDIAQKNFTNYQYANDALGRFIQKVKSSAFGHRTIIAASGDHNTLQTLNYPEAFEFQKVSVPFILYVPPALRPEIKEVNVLASSKDIFPTLYHLSLSKSHYLASGISLFDSNALAQNFALNEFSLAFSLKGEVEVGTNRMASWEKSPESVSCFWPGNQQHALFLSKKSVDMEASHVIETRARAYTAIMTYLIQRECAGIPFFKDKKRRPI